ncbi:hypothetical protein [Streptomyces sp. NPDC051014]|uniref:hypothetical protein n=1 Tax=Streptomyces sp. NPDC051014 TaxID=3155751 RepID=UPI00340C362C
MLHRILVGLRRFVPVQEDKGRYEAEYDLLDRLDDDLTEAEIRHCAEELGTRLIRLAGELEAAGVPATSLAGVLDLAAEPLPHLRGRFRRRGRAAPTRALLTRRALALEDLLRQLHR